MTSDEIKAAYSMMDILARYGLQPNRSGFISCPFHKEKTASCKIYKDSFHCFGCGISGDIFTFVQEMEGVDFKEAFSILGGTYEQTLKSQIRTYHAKKKRETEKLREDRLQAKREINNLLIDVYRKWLDRFEPLSQAWTDTYNALQYQLYLHESLNDYEKGW